MKRVLMMIVGIVLMSSVYANGQESVRGYRGYADFAIGDAYNFNTAQLISTNNMQLYSMVSTTHGYVMGNWFVGAGIGYCHTFRDGENMFPVYAAGSYTFGTTKLKPYIEARAGMIYDPLWVRTVQAYGSLGAGMSVYKRLQVGLRLSMFSRLNRYFTANAAVTIGYAFGK